MFHDKRSSGKNTNSIATNAVKIRKPKRFSIDYPQTLSAKMFDVDVNADVVTQNV